MINQRTIFFSAGSARRFSLAIMGVLGVSLGGCEYDSFLADPSVLGRWEYTPTIVPVLDRISTIEERTGEEITGSAPAPEDLVPRPLELKVQSGDDLEIVLHDLVEIGRAESYKRSVDGQGQIDLPQLGSLSVAGKDLDGVRRIVAQKMSEYVKDPLVEVRYASQRQQTFSIIGAVDNPGPYFIPKPNYRLLEALTAAGRFPENSKDVYIIRAGGAPAIAKAHEREHDAPAKPQPRAHRRAPEPERDTQIFEVVDGLSGVPDAQPGMMGDPEREPAPARAGQRSARQASSQRWVYAGGDWVREDGGTASPSMLEPAEHGAASPSSSPRVIRVALRPLLAGDSSQNIVVRPGDVIRIPGPTQGEVYVGGQIQRPGVYALPASENLTLKRVVIAAGGLGNLAVPERVDLTRFVGDGRQATVRLDLRAIEEGTQPDIYLKAGDQINIGTNFWALPLSVVRNGFRTTYGFGFVLDRNFGNDVFGPPPEDANAN